MFKVGQKVVCIRGALICKCLVKDKVYTCLGFNDRGWVIVDCCNDCIGWLPDRFRPIVERKTDISIFNALLTPAGQKERV